MSNARGGAVLLAGAALMGFMIGADSAASESAEQSLSGEALQLHLRRQAASLPGMACDGFGTVYEVIGRSAAAPQRLLDTIDYIVRVNERGYFDEVRVARSSGDEDLDFDIAGYLCNSAKVTERTLPGWKRVGGWGQLSIRLRG